MDLHFPENQSGLPGPGNNIQRMPDPSSKDNQQGAGDWTPFFPRNLRGSYQARFIKPFERISQPTEGLPDFR
jgi:hypothetical protein